MALGDQVPTSKLSNEMTPMAMGSAGAMSCPDPAREMNISFKFGFAAICGSVAAEYMTDVVRIKTGSVKRAGMMIVGARVRLASLVN
jgi:hypothetical protein